MASIALNVSMLHVAENKVVIRDVVKDFAVESDIFEESRETGVVFECASRVKPLLEPCSYLVGLGGY